MTAASAADILDSWALRVGPSGVAPGAPDRAPACAEPVLPADPKAHVLYRTSPESLVIPGYDDTQEGDPDRNAMPIEESMVLSVMALGVLEPIMVRRREDGAFEIIAGRRRTRHAREANRRLVLDGEAPIAVRVMVWGSRLSPEMAAVVDTTLNEHRENDPLPVKIRKAAKMVSRYIDPRTVAVAYRVDPATIASWVLISKADAAVPAALEARRIGIEAAVDLARLPLTAQLGTLEKLLEIGPVRVHEAAIVRAAKRRAPTPGRVPRRAVRWILAEPGAYDPEFIRGIRFLRGELSEGEIRDIMSKVGR